MTEPAFPMRAPCRKCGHANGVSDDRNGQDTIYCAACNSYAYNRPKTESGQPTRSVRSRPNMKPKTRQRVLAVHHHRCFNCGRAAPDVILHVDHFIPLAAATRCGIDPEFIESEVNLVPLCEECNLGKQDDLDCVSHVHFHKLLKLKAAND
jgi:5-methylcytosine-specific restriction endonuclease McrA